LDPLRLSCEVRRVTLREYRVPSGHYVRDDIVEYQDPQTGYVERFIVTVFFLKEQGRFVERLAWKVTESKQRDLEWSFPNVQGTCRDVGQSSDGSTEGLDSDWTVVKSRMRKRKCWDSRVTDSEPQRRAPTCEEDWPLEIYAQDVSHGDHCRMDWTGCFNDWCSFHDSGKGNAGWLPRRPRWWKTERARFEAWKCGRSGKMN